MEELMKQAVYQLEALLSSELIKLDSLENQLTLIDKMIFKLEKYKQRITYRVAVTSTGDNFREDTITDENSSVATVQLNILVNPKYKDDDLIQTHSYVTSIENDTENGSDDLPNTEIIDIKDQDDIHEADIFIEKKDDIFESVVEESLIFMNEENEVEESIVKNQLSAGQEYVDFSADNIVPPEQQDLHIPFTNRDKEINWFQYYQRTENGFICNTCEKILKGSSQMKEHVRDNHGVGSTLFQCQNKGCEYSTLSGSQFRAHKSWHANNAALTCPVCKKEYLGGSKGLKNHMKIHSKRRDFICDSCNKSFVNLSRLNFHIQNVHGEQTYLCEFCNRQFKSKANFTRHQLTHRSEKPFTCHHCPFSTAGSTSLTSHVRNVHKEFDFSAGKANKIKKKEDRIKELPPSKAVNMQTVVNKVCKSIGFINKPINRNDIRQLKIQQAMKRNNIYAKRSHSNIESSQLYEVDDTITKKEPVISVKIASDIDS